MCKTVQNVLDQPKMSDDKVLESSKFKLQLLTNENYFLWCNIIEIILRGRGLSNVVCGNGVCGNETKSQVADTPEYEPYFREQDQALSFLSMTIND